MRNCRLLQIVGGDLWVKGDFRAHAISTKMSYAGTKISYTGTKMSYTGTKISYTGIKMSCWY